MRKIMEKNRSWSALEQFITAVVLTFGILVPGSVAAQETGTVSGRVVNATTRAPIAEVQVSVDGTNRGALTNASGRYLIPGVPAGTHALRASHIGYTTVTDVSISVTAGETTTQDIELSSAIIGLDEVVVTGTGAPTQRRQLGQTISSVTSEQLQEAPIANATDALRGGIPGLVSDAMGETGSGAHIKLRGTVSLSQRTDPIIYIDGIRVDNTLTQLPVTNVATSRLDDINPSDIDRIEVIKGAAAATLYGTEASAGVIQVFTKRGQSGDPSYTFEISQHAMSTPQRKIPRNYGYSSTHKEITSNFPASDHLRIGHRQSYSLSARGGTPSVRYYASGRFMDERGTLPTNEESNRTGRMALDFNHSDRLTSKFDVSITRNSLSVPSPGWGLVGEFLLANPWDANEERPYGELWYTVPGAKAYNNTQNAATTTVSGALEYTWSENINSKISAGYNEVDIGSVRSVPVAASPVDPDGLRDVYNSSVSNITLDASTNLTLDVTDKLSATTTFGGQSFWETNVEQRTGVREFSAAGLNTLRGGATVYAVDEFKEEVINAGIYFQQQVGLSDRLFLTAGIRVDGNSAFGDDFGFESYPKIGASWVLSDESFWSLGDLGFDLLRLRGAYGTSGLQPGAFDAQRTWRPASLIANKVAVLPENIGNPDLRPERSSEIEAAAELGFADGRVGFEFVYWTQKTTGALLPKPEAPSRGFLNTQLTNIGSLASSGIEAMSNIKIYQSPSFGLDVDASVTTTDQIVRDLGGIPSFRLADARRWNRIQEGYAPGAVLAPVNDPANPYSVSVDIEDLTDLSQISPNLLKTTEGEDSLVYIGDAQPKWTVSLGGTIRIGDNLNFRTLFSGAGGFIMSNETENVRAGVFITETAANFRRELDDPNTTTERRAEIAEAWGMKHPTVMSTYMYDADYLRWSEISANYTVPDSWLGGLGVGRTTVSIGARNVALWSKYEGLNDPGTTTWHGNPVDGAALVSNIDYYGMPAVRRFVFTLRTTF